MTAQASVPRVRLVTADDDDFFGEPPEVDRRPEVRLGIDWHRVVDETIDIWATADAGIFSRAGELATVVDTEAKGLELAPLTPRVLALSPSGVSNRLSRHVRFIKRTKNGDEYVAPVSRLVGELLARGEWPGTRTLVGITEAPVLRPDGTVCQTPGYDPTTGYLYVPSARYPAVPPSPTQVEAQAALEALREPFADFPFADPSHAVVPIAAILTMLARPAIRGAIPGFAFDAATRGSGKSLLADAVAMISTGRAASRTTYPEDDVELEKVLSAYALSGARLVLLDNVTRRFGGGPLDKVLTAQGDVDLRVLGESTMVRTPWTAALLASGNNMTFGEDTLRRMLLCRLESNLERPETRSGFAHERLLDYLRAERGRLVVAGLTVLRAWTCKRLPVTTGVWGSFEAWAELVPPAIVFAGGPNVMLAKPADDRAGDDTLNALGTVLECLPKLSADALTASRIVDALYPGPGEHDPPDGHDALRDAFDALGAVGRGRLSPSSKGLSNALTRVAGRVMGSYRLRTVVAEHQRVFWVERLRQDLRP